MAVSETSAPSLDAGRSTRVSWRMRLLIAAGVAAAAVALYLLLRTGADDVLRWDLRFGPSFERRLKTVAAIVLAAFCQGVATVLFHTVTHNRILTPSIIGLDALYVLIQTVGVAVVGARFVDNSDSVGQFLLQTAGMVLFAVSPVLVARMRVRFEDPAGAREAAKAFEIRVNNRDTQFWALVLTKRSTISTSPRLYSATK